MQIQIILVLLLLSFSHALTVKYFEDLTRAAIMFESCLILINHLQTSPGSNYPVLENLKVELKYLQASFFTPEFLGHFCESFDFDAVPLDDREYVEKMILNVYRAHISNPWAEVVDYKYINKSILTNQRMNYSLKTIKSNRQFKAEFKEILSKKNLRSRLFEAKGRENYLASYKANVKSCASKHLYRYITKVLIDSARIQTGCDIETFDDIRKFAKSTPELPAFGFNYRNIKDGIIEFPNYKFTKK